jgi:mRNA interferase RelE/StbE
LAYDLIILPAAERDLRRLSRVVTEHRRLIAAIGGLRNEPRPAGCVKLAERDAWRIRVGDYRVIYQIEDTVRVVRVVRIGHRSDVYD